jgi:hypothetical protein
MPLRIGCDLDGTLADLDSALEREAATVLGPQVERPSGLRARRQRRAVWDHIAAKPDFWTTLAEAEPGAVVRLASAAAAGEWEIIFLTQRPATAGETTQRQSQRWLEAHGFDRPSVFVVSGSRGKIAAALDLQVVLDDRARNCVDVISDSEAASVLVWRQPPDRVPPGVSRLRIDVVFSMAAAIDRLQQLDRISASSSGVIGRVRHALRPWWTARRASPSVSQS